MCMWKPTGKTALLAVAAIAVIAGGCTDSTGAEAEPELRVVVGGRTLGEWLLRVEEHRVRNADEAVLAARSLLVAKRYDHWTIRSRACDAASALARSYDEVVPELVPWLTADKSNATRATWCLAELTPRVAAAVPAVADLLGSHDPAVRSRAESALRNAAPTAAETIGALLVAGNGRERRSAANILSRYAGKRMITDAERRRVAPIAVANLLERLADADPLERRGAAPQVGSWGADATFAVPELMKALTTEGDTATRTCILQSVHSIGWATPVPAEFARQLAGVALDEHEDDAVVANAILCLGDIDDVSSEIPDITARVVADMHADDVARRRRAAAALSSLASRENGGVAALVVALDDEDRDVRRRAATSLYRTDDGGPDVVAALRALRDASAADVELRRVVETTLRQVEGE